jgi:adenylate kinase
MKLILLGAPGAGKGTQADIISRKLAIPTISTGNILRAAIRNSTPIGIKARSYMDSGNLVPDDVIIGIMKERLAKSDCANGYILDGMPRTITQAEALEDAGVKVDVALVIEASDAEIMDRMTGRRTCGNCGATYHIRTNPPKTDNICDVCGDELVLRKDDKPETVINRLKVYHQETEPLIEYFKSRGKLKTVENLSIEATTEVIFRTLGI